MSTETTTPIDITRPPDPQPGSAPTAARWTLRDVTPVRGIGLWTIAALVFVAFFEVYSFRLGVEPLLFGDDYDYTYPAFSLAERGNFGSPVLGPALNVENRNYRFTVYYYAAVHAVLIRIFGDGPEAIPLANTFHFALLAGAGAAFLLRRRAFLGAAVLLYALTHDELMTTWARRGRPEPTAAFCLLLGMIALWRWCGEEDHRSAVLFVMSAAFAAGILSHSGVAFFVMAVWLYSAVPLVRHARPRQIAAGLVPWLAVLALYTYFALTDSVANIRAQLQLQQVNLSRCVLMLLLQGEWADAARQALLSLRANFWNAGIWLALVGCLALPIVVPSRAARAARFFAGLYGSCLLAHLLFLKPLHTMYRNIHQAALYVALAFLAEALVERICQWRRRPGGVAWLQVSGALLLVGLSIAAMIAFRQRIYGQHPPYHRLRSALMAGLLESGAQTGDRVFVPIHFGFHLRKDFRVTAQPAPEYFQGRWSPAFRDGLRRIWGKEALERTDTGSLCQAMDLAFIRPKWVVWWSLDYEYLHPFRDFLKRFPPLPGMSLIETRRVSIPVYGVVRIYRLSLSPAIDDLDRTVQPAEGPCP